MAIADLNNRRFKYGGKSYFIAGAHECQVGSIGNKRAPLGKPKYIDVNSHISPEKIGTLEGTVVDVEFHASKSSTLKSLFPINLPGTPIPAPIDLSIDAGRITEGHLKLFHLWATDQHLENAINASPRKREDLIAWGNSARVVSQIFVVIEGNVVEKIGTQSSFQVGKSIEGLIGVQIGGDGGRAGRVDLTLSRRSIFAYQLAKLDWDANRKKNKRLVVDIEDDQFGSG